MEENMLCVQRMKCMLHWIDVRAHMTAANKTHRAIKEARRHLLLILVTIQGTTIDLNHKLSICKISWSKVKYLPMISIMIQNIAVCSSHIIFVNFFERTFERTSTDQFSSKIMKT